MMRLLLLLTLLSALPGVADDKKRTTVYRTNYVTVSVLCAPLEVADLALQGGHRYRVLVADGAQPWRTWAYLQSPTNVTYRLWVPAASTRPMAWQVLDATPGFPTNALPKLAPDCTSKTQWVLLGRGNLRPVR
jgi:hypothetical protein